MKRVVVFTGGGTAGHVNPALEVISQLWKREPALAVRWIGSVRGIERQIVAQAFGKKVRFYAIPCGKWRRYVSWRNVVAPFLIVAGVLVALVLLLFLSPSLVFSKGGYVSVPVVVVAGLLRIPVISHESDLTIGLATRINARFSRRLCLPHRRALDFLPSSLRRKALISGTPIRQQIRDGSAERGWTFVAQRLARYGIGAQRLARYDTGARHTDGMPAASDEGGGTAGVARRPVVLFVGGSLGAEQINRMVADIGPRIIDAHDCVLVHQTGVRHDTAGLTDKHAAGRYLPLPYIADEMGDLLALATVVVSRAGANALWECATLKKAMVLVPLSSASSRGDQILNAQFFSEHDGAYIAQDTDALVAALNTLLTDDRRREEVGRNAHRLTIPHASTVLADLFFAHLPSGDK